MIFISALTGVIRRLTEQRGQTMAEYAVLISVIAVIVVLAAVLFGINVSSLFSSSAPQV